MADSKEKSAIVPDEGGIISYVYSFVKKVFFNCLSDCVNLNFLKAAVVGIVFAAGYFNFSVAWFVGPIILSVIRDQWRIKNERKRTVAKIAALSSEKDLVLARIDDLPSWVRTVVFYRTSEQICFSYHKLQCVFTENTCLS